MYKDIGEEREGEGGVRICTCEFELRHRNTKVTK